MKKFIYLLAFSFAFVNYSCTTLANLFGGAGVCNCTCAACVNCTGKHHVLTEEQKAALEAQQLKQAQEDAKRQAELDSLLNMDYTIVHYDLPEVKNDPYKWDDDEDDEDTYWEMRIGKSELTSHLTLLITDFADDDDADGLKILWESNLDRLHRASGL